METFEQLRSLLGEVLQLGGRADKLEPSTGLIGNLPEFDSMAVVSLVTAMEERFGFEIQDDELDAEIFETVGSLCNFVGHKKQAGSSDPHSD